MTPQELKNSILQLAIQGKLVEQRPEEGTAENLYKQIQAEKQALIKAGKVKKEKSLPDITEDEKPFEIPDSWMWVRLGTLLRVIGGISYDKKDVTTSGYRILRGGNIQQMKVLIEENDVFLPEQYRDEDKLIREGDILIVASTGSKTVIGKAGYVDRPIADTMIGAFLRICRPFQTTTVNYLRCLFDSEFYRKHIRELSQGTNINNVKETYITGFAVPLPPIAEQKRIVAKIEELLPLIDRYEQAWTKLEDFNKRFPVDMQKSILQMAIQGKLVPQDPSEGTGEDFYGQIQIEKAKLIKEGKLKKEKPLAEIGKNETPFEIPDTWKWVYLSDIATFENGDRSSKYPVEADYVDFGIPFLGAKDMNGKYVSFDNVRYISQRKYDELGNGKLQDQDFICLLRGSVGKCAIFKADDNHKTGFICAQMIIIRSISRLLCDYIYYYLTTPYYSKSIESKVTGTAVRQLPGKELGKLFVPLPPIGEQKRIVAKLDELLPLCERLK